MTEKMYEKNFRYIFLILLLLVLPLAASSPDVNAKSADDADARKAIVSESIRNFPGNCPCPYNRAKDGSPCGIKSAWSKHAGYAPFCYEKEVPEEMVRQWKQIHGKIK